MRPPYAHVFLVWFTSPGTGISATGSFNIVQGENPQKFIVPDLDELEKMGYDAYIARLVQLYAMDHISYPEFKDGANWRSEVTKVNERLSYVVLIYREICK